jgi:hypothetical protein
MQKRVHSLHSAGFGFIRSAHSIRLLRAPHGVVVGALLVVHFENISPRGEGQVPLRLADRPTPNVRSTCASKHYRVWCVYFATPSALPVDRLSTFRLVVPLSNFQGRQKLWSRRTTWEKAAR